MESMTMPAARLAGFDQAAAGFRDACRAFAYMAGTWEQVKAAESVLRAAGTDPVTGLVSIPATAVHFGDVRADGARMRAVNGSLLGGSVWIHWAGGSLPYGESRDYEPGDLILVRAR